MTYDPEAMCSCIASPCSTSTSESESVYVHTPTYIHKMPSCELNIDILMRRTRVTQEQLDRRIKEEKLWELAGFLVKYKQ